MNPTRQRILDELADRILALRPAHPVRVGIDGHSAAGKTTLADDLATTLRARTARPVLRVMIDHFKRHVDLRTVYPAGSPESYYHEMFDVEAIQDELLVPLGPGGDRRYRTQIMDLRGRTPVDSGVRVAPDDAILVADGGFLQRPALAAHWDLCVYLHVEPADVLRRGAARDQAWMGSPEAAAARYRDYYIPGELLYLAEVGPAGRADLVVDNRDVEAPRVLRLRWYRGDCHVHTRRSHGGELSPGDVVAAARAAGLDFIAVTEHNAVGADAFGDAGLLVIPGQEVVTETGHWLALGGEPGRVVDWRYGVRDDLIDRSVAQVHRAGGLCVVAHPYAPYPSGTFMYPFDGFDAVEVWNGRWRSELPWNADNEAALAEWGRGLAAGIHRGRWRPAVGNSDVHLRDQIGVPQTVVLAVELGAAAVLAGIRAGRCWIAGSAGITLSFTARAGDREAGIGQRLNAGGEVVAVRLEIGGVPSGTVTFHTERGRAHHHLLPPQGAGLIEWSTSAAESAFVRVEVRDRAGDMAALTNPVILT